MKKKLLIIVICLSAVFSFSCSNVGWKGLYDEDLSKYVTLADYKKLTYEKREVAVTDEDVTSRIDLLLEAATELAETDKGFEAGMTISFDRYCFVNGQAAPELSHEGGIYAFDGTEYENEAVSLLLPLLVGLKKGDTASFEITLSDGTKATYNVTVLALYEIKNLALTDENASKLISGCNTVSELKAEIRRRLTDEREREAELEAKTDLRKELVDRSTLLRVPYSLYNDYYDDRMYLYEKLAEAASMPLSEYLEKCSDMTYDELEKLISDAATADVKETLVLYSIVKKEKISASKQDIYDFAAEMASRSEGIFGSGEEYLSYYGENSVKDEYLWSKAIEVVISGVQAAE